MLDMAPSQDSSDHQDDITFLALGVPVPKPLFATGRGWGGPHHGHTWYWYSHKYICIYTWANKNPHVSPQAAGSPAIPPTCSRLQMHSGWNLSSAKLRN